MTTRIEPMTIEAFAAFAEREMTDTYRLELIHGEIIEMSPARAYRAGMGTTMVVEVSGFCRDHALPFYATAGEGAYNIGGNVIAPDFAYKPTPLSDDYPDPVPPSLAAEVRSPTDEQRAIDIKRQIYLDAGILLWEINPDKRQATQYTPGQPPHLVTLDEALDGGAVLPGFMLPLRTLFH